MTGPTPSWHELTVGHQYPPVSLRLRAADAADYADVVGQGHNPYGRGGVAPLSLDTLYPVKEVLNLPTGTVHARESIEFHATPDLAAALEVQLSITDKFERRGRLYVVVEHTVYVPGGAPVMTAHKTFVWPTTCEEEHA